MIPVATSAQMRECDRTAIEYLKLPGLVLMENASRAVAFQVMEMLGGDANERRIAVFCGKGNNGGDGFAAARHLLNAGASASVYLLGETAHLTGDAKFNCELYQKLGGSLAEVKTAEDLPSSTSSFDLIIDALLGTGFQGEVKGLYAAAINLINAIPAPVVAVDIPSGVEADSGAAAASSVEAEVTVTFGLAKRGLLIPPGREKSGKVTIADISIPASVVAAQNLRLHIPEERDVRRAIPRRHPAAHKGDMGYVFLLAGSPGFMGAACLAAEAALRAGAGLVAVGTPRSQSAIIQSRLVEAMTLPLSETSRGTLADDFSSELQARLDWATVVAIGPGLGRDPETARLLEKVFKYIHVPVVIDADGLNLLAEHPSLIAALPKDAILTPHPGEFSRLLGQPMAQWLSERFETSTKFVQARSVTLVLKDSPTLTTALDGRQYLNPTGNAGMASGGSGDVLTGLIAGLRAQGLDNTTAAWLGVYLHGEAGDRTAEALGEAGMIAGDILTRLPEVLKAYL